MGLVSCQKTSSVEQSISFDAYVVDTVCALFKNYDKPACHLSIEMNVPSVATSEELSQSVEHFITNLPKDGAFEEPADGKVETMIKNYVHSYLLDYLNEGPDAIDSYGEDMEAAATWMSYEEHIEGNVLHNGDGLLSYQVRTFSYTGGAHGNTKTYNGVFDLRNMNQLILSNIFDDLSMQDLNNMLRQQLVKDYDCESLEQLAEKSLFFDPSVIEATENFYVTDSCINWLFDPYDIAPFSTGEVVISLPWDEVYPLLKSGTTVFELAEK